MSSCAACPEIAKRRRRVYLGTNCVLCTLTQLSTALPAPLSAAAPSCPLEPSPGAAGAALMLVAALCAALLAVAKLMKGASELLTCITKQRGSQRHTCPAGQIATHMRTHYLTMHWQFLS